ncbi:MAG: glycosyltransferase [Flavobacteriaceae bacterium]|nr:glycosyltransferase [Flavobacteriaceae bacterium]
MSIKEYIYPPKQIHFSEIPIIINNFNRLEYLKKLLVCLEKRDYKNIVILDNQSTYPPLLKFYKNCKHKVIFLDKNYGYRALWKSGIYKQYQHNFFVYTDADLEIIDECPNDFMEFFRSVLQEHKKCKKVGFSLKIDDLPETYALKKEVIDWESQFYKEKVSKLLYRAQLDTTFAMYRPFSFKHTASHIPLMYRVGYPYQIKHLPWYVNHKNLSEEEKYYMETTRVKSWADKLDTKIHS